MDEMIFTLVTHNNNNDIILRSWSILFDEVVGHAAQLVGVWCHLTIFKCQPRPAWFPNVLEWPLCSIFCFVLSLFHLWICFSLRLFLFCQGRRHFLRDTSYGARFFFFGRKIFVGHLVRQTGIFCRTLWKNVRLSDKSDEFWQHCRGENISLIHVTFTLSNLLTPTNVIILEFVSIVTNNSTELKKSKFITMSNFSSVKMKNKIVSVNYAFLCQQLYICHSMW